MEKLTKRNAPRRVAGWPTPDEQPVSQMKPKENGMRMRQKRAAAPRNREKHPLINPLFVPLCESKDVSIKVRFFDILEEERALGNPDERAFFRTALEYRQKLFTPHQQGILVQTARAKFGLAV